MWLMLQKEIPDDYVIATNRAHSIREFLKVAFRRIRKDYNDYVEVSSKFFGPTELDLLIGNSAKAKKKLGWQPKTDFSTLINFMVDADIQRITHSKL